jgi:hypothetical protein
MVLIERRFYSLLKSNSQSTRRRGFPFSYFNASLISSSTGLNGPYQVDGFPPINGLFNRVRTRQIGNTVGGHMEINEDFGFE